MTSHFIETDHTMLDALQSISHPRVPTRRFQSKAANETAVQNALLQISKLQPQPDWPSFASLLFRNEPDRRGMIITVLPNEDTLTALLAVRAGIDLPTAISLAYRDLIFAARIDHPDGSPESALGASLCGTFWLSDAGQMFRYALFATEAARDYRPEWQREELILLQEREDGSFYWDSLDLNASSQIYNLWDHSTEESLVFLSMENSTHTSLAD